MANIINGRNLNLYYKLNGVTYPACFATDCKLTLTADTQETTTKNSLKGKTFDYQGKYSYTLSLRGITSFIQLAGVSTFEYSMTENTVDGNLYIYKNGYAVVERIGTGSGSVTMNSGQTYHITALSGFTGGALNPKLTLIVTKNDNVIYAQTVPCPPGTQLNYEGIVDINAIYVVTVIARNGGPDEIPVNIPDTGAPNATSVNVGTFQDFILQSNKMDFIFTDAENIEWSGTVLLTQVDNDSPVDNVSTFTNAMLGDGELTKVTGSIVPPPVGSAVTISDQLGNILAIVPAPGVYTVTKFDSIDLGDSTMPTPDIIITQS